MLEKIHKHLATVLGIIWASYTTIAQLTINMFQMADEYTTAFVVWTLSVVLACSAVASFLSNHRVKNAVEAKDDEIAELNAQKVERLAQIEADAETERQRQEREHRDQERRDRIKEKFAALSKAEKQLLYDMTENGNTIVIANQDSARMVAAETMRKDEYVEFVESLSQGIDGCYFVVNRSLLEEIAGNEDAWSEALEKAGVPNSSIFPLSYKVGKSSDKFQEYKQAILPSKQTRPSHWL